MRAVEETPHTTWAEIAQVVKHLEISNKHQREVTNQLAEVMTYRNPDGELTDAFGTNIYEAVRYLAIQRPRIATPTTLARSPHVVRNVKTYSNLFDDPEHSEGIMRQAYIRAHGAAAYEKLLRAHTAEVTA